MQSPACNSEWFAATLSLECIITHSSPGTDQFTGYSAKELVGRPITQLLSDSSAFALIQILDEVNKAGHWEGKIIHRTRAGISVEARSTLSLLIGAEHRPAGFLLFSCLIKPSGSVAQDDFAISEVGSRLRAFAHDLNNPLAVMAGFSQLLMMNSDCQGTMRADVEKLYSELQRVIQTVETLHRYAISLHEKPRIAVNS